MVNDTIDYVLKYQNNTNRRWKSVKIALIGDSHNKLHIFDSKNNRWTDREYPFASRYSLASVLVDDTMMIIDGENSSVMYVNLKDGQIHTLESIHQKRDDFSVAAIPGHSSTNVYVIGGSTLERFAGFVDRSSVERWNSESKKWDFVAPLSTAVSNHSCSVVDDEIYATGGRLESGVPTKRIQRYSSKTGEWVNYITMRQKRSSHSSTSLNGKLFVAGGLLKTGVCLDSVEVLDPKENKWTEYCILPSPRYNCCLMNYRNKLLCIGGFAFIKNGFIELDDVLEYNDEKAIWKPSKRLITGVYGSHLSAFVIPHNSIV